MLLEQRSQGRRRGYLAAIAVLLCGLAFLSPDAVRAAGPATEFSAGISAGASPWGLAAGPDGNLWFTEFNGSRIGVITPSGTVTEFSAGITGGANPVGIAAGADGNLWFAARDPDRIGRVTPTGTITEFTNGLTAGARPFGITAGPDGNLWFTEPNGNRVGRVTPAGAIMEFPGGISAGSAPADITAGPDGNLWFTEQQGNRIGRITPAGVVTEFSGGISPGANLQSIAQGPDGNLWFSEYNLDRIGRITPNGTVTEFSAGLTAGGHPRAIVGGPDGNVWFVETDGARIGRITPAGVVTEFSSGITSGSLPIGLAPGPDGNLWFAEANGNRIGRIGTDAPAPVSGNLLRNPGFELGAAGSARLVTVPIPGWVTIPNFTAGLYGGTDLPSAALSDQVGGGHGFAFGGPNADEQTHALQLVDVARESTAIDEGRAAVTVSGLLGGQDAQQDVATVSAQFLNGSGGVLSSLQIGPVTPADRGGKTTLLARSASGSVPAGTRAIRVVPTATNIGGGSNNGYFDNLSLTLDVTPPPPGPDAPSPTGAPGGAAPVPDTVAPAFLVARLTNKRFAVDTRATAEVAVAALAKKGTTFLYTLSETAAVRFAIEQRQKGRKVGTKCRKPSKANRTRKPCTRYVKIGNFAQDGAAGPNTKKFAGKIGKRKLKPGIYRATLRATDSGGNRSSVKRLAFKVVRR